MKTLVISLFLFIVGSLGVFVYCSAEEKRQQAVSQLIKEERSYNLHHTSAVQANLPKEPQRLTEGKF